jgi:hypothetical protein
MSKRAVNLLRNMAVPMKRDATNPNYGFVATVAAAAGATTTLTAADSGKVVLMAPNAAAVALPAAVSGLCYTIIQTGDYASAASTVTAQAGDFMAGGIAAADSGHGAVADGDSNLVATFGSATDAGDRLELWSDGTLWFVGGFMAETSNGIAFSDS